MKILIIFDSIYPKMYKNMVTEVLHDLDETISLEFDILNKQEVDVDKVIHEQYNFILLPLSLPKFQSLKLVEKTNVLKLNTRFLLISATDVESDLLHIIYDNVLRPPLEIEELRSSIVSEAFRSRDTEKVNQAIYQVIAEANCFKDMREKLEYRTMKNIRENNLF